MILPCIKEAITELLLVAFQTKKDEDGSKGEVKGLGNRSTIIGHGQPDRRYAGDN